jgi:hypothetical protein
MIEVAGRNLQVQGKLLKIARLDGEKYLFLDDPKPLVEDLRKSANRADIFTFLQRVTETAPKYDYPMEWDNFAALPLTTFDNWWMKQIGFKARNKAKQAEKRGVTLKEVPFDDVLVHGIWEIYNETPVRQGKRFPHYGMSIEQIRRYAGTFLDKSVFIGAFLDEKMIGFIKLTMDETRTQAGLMHIVSLVSQRDKAPTNALVTQAVRSCADRKIGHLVYSNFAYGKKQRDSLSDFKERNAFQRVDIPRYYVPLTPIGKAALSFGMHHKLADRMPESVMAKLRDYRTAWYERKSKSVEAEAEKAPVQLASQSAKGAQ